MSSELLLIDDDEVYNQVLGRALERRGFSVSNVIKLDQVLSTAEEVTPSYIVLDLNLNGESSLDLIPVLLRISPYAKIIVLTGYASIPSAVKAVKLGAYDYLAKPTSVEIIVKTLISTEKASEKYESPKFMSIQRMEWEYIQRVLMVHDGNIAATARALTMHRRTLQRKLIKRPPIT